MTVAAALKKKRPWWHWVLLVVGSLALCGELASIGQDDKPAPQGIADQQQLAATEAPEAPEATSTATESATLEPATATNEPEPTATDEPPTPEPPTAVPPTDPPPPPTAVPEPPTPAGPVNPRPDVDAGGDVDCKDFASRREAQAWWDFWHAQGVPNPGRLDGNDQDGLVCERY